MDPLNMSTDYWNGKPAELASKSIRARQAPTQGYIDQFATELKEAIETNQTLLDQTIDNKQNGEEPPEKVEDTEIDNLDTIVEQEINGLTITGGDEATAYKEKLKEGLKMSKKSIDFIKKLKQKLADEKANNAIIQENAQKTIEEIAQLYAGFEVDKAQKEDEANKNLQTKIKINKMVAQNPPPKFDNYRGGKSAADLILFLNEELEEYFEDLCIFEKLEKCRLLTKIYGNDCAQHKQTTKRFLQQKSSVEMIENENITMMTVYKELVHFIYAVRPEGNVGKRRATESLTNFLERWFTLKDYCGSKQQTQGLQVMKSIFNNTRILNCQPEVLTKFKEEFYVKQLCNKPISKNEVMGFAQRLDMLYADEKASEMHVLSAATPSAEVAGLIAIEKGKTEEVERLTKLVEQMLEANKSSDKKEYNRNPQTYNNNRSQRAIQCWKCQGYGHIARKCRAGNQGQKQFYNNNNNNKKHYNNYNNNNKNFQNAQKPAIADYNNVVNQVSTFEVQMNKMSMEFNEQGELREYLITEVVPGTSEKTLLDTGASESAVSEELIKQINLEDKIDRSHSGNVAMANNSVVQSAGRIKINIAIKSISYAVDFVVVSDLSPRVILGAPFLNQTGILKKFKDAVREAGLKN